MTIPISIFKYGLYNSTAFHAEYMFNSDSLHLIQKKTEKEAIFKHYFTAQNYHYFCLLICEPILSFRKFWADYAALNWNWKHTRTEWLNIITAFVIHSATQTFDRTANHASRSISLGRGCSSAGLTGSLLSGHAAGDETIRFILANRYLSTFSFCSHVKSPMSTCSPLKLHSSTFFSLGIAFVIGSRYD